MKHLLHLISGVLFGIGLAASGMTDPAKVIGFLDIFGTWVPDLLFVMASAVMTTMITFRFILKRPFPLFSSHFRLPESTKIDVKLILGAILFGIGWGLFGYCPGPALASIVYLQPVTAIFLCFMFIGMFIGHKLSSGSGNAN